MATTGKAEAAAPVTFRMKSAADRALLEAVAQHSQTTLSKFVADTMSDFAREYVKLAGGPEKFSAELQEIHEREQRKSRRWLSEVLDVAGEKSPNSALDESQAAEDSSFSARTNN